MATQKAKPADATGRKFLRQPPTEFIHALARTKLPGEATRLMAYLYDRANPEKPMAFITLKATAGDMGISEWTVKRSLDTLENLDRVSVKVLPSGTRIVVVKPLPAPDRTPPETWAKQIEQVWEELGAPPSNSATPPSSSAGDNEQDRQGRGAELPAPPSSSAQENAESQGPERGSANRITHTNHPHQSPPSNHPAGSVTTDSGDLAEQCRGVLGWTWDDKQRRDQAGYVAELLREHSADDILACVQANRGNIKSSLRALGTMLPRWKAARGSPTDLPTCAKCGLPVTADGKKLRGRQTASGWRHFDCDAAAKAKRCLSCGRPVDPLLPGHEVDIFEPWNPPRGYTGPLAGRVTDDGAIHYDPECAEGD